jgi:ATP-dependent helicase/nuclease subunit A
MSLTKDQKRAAYATGSVAVTAGAGTGKTHMLTERYLHFLRQGFSPLQIVAVTFTDKAATELRYRIREAVVAEMSDRLDTLADFEAAQISTFHALATRICQEHPEHANVPPDFVVQDKIESSLWRVGNFDHALAQLPAQLYETVPFSLMQGVMTALLDDPLTAERALQRNSADYLPAVEAHRQALLEGISQQPEWLSACAELNLCVGPAGDKIEAARQQAIEIATAFENTSDISYLDAFSEISLSGGSKSKWPDLESFNAVKEAIKALKVIARKSVPVLAALVPNEYDDQTEALLPVFREAFTWVRSFLQQAKYQQRILDFSDLEVHSIKALGEPAVQQYYAQRWKVFLIDEFQDTNPTQGKLLESLTTCANITIVGDRKQSIYGFRRADTAVFQSWQERIHPGDDAPVELCTSFRTHRLLMAQINQVFAPVLAKLHQPLESARDEALEPTPEIQLYSVVVDEEQTKDKSLDTSIEACRLVEAQKIADLVQSMLVDAPIQVHDKSSGQLRLIEPKDIAILGRTWGPLDLYGNAISARGIAVLQAGGGSLLDTREAKDALAMLRFLADPTDSLALAALLRSPFFAVSDRTLYTFTQSLPERTSWWKHLQDVAVPELAYAGQVLKKLLIARRVEAPTRLLQMCDRLTGYTAVIANLSGADRRMADWNGFIELVRSLEQGSFDVLTVLRRLKQIMSANVTVPRPAVKGGNAVSLMTIHGSKGLEWPVVFIPDLTHTSKLDTPVVRFDAGLGVALKLSDRLGEPQKSAFYALLEQQTKVADKEESKRVFYVALTRARDQLVLTSASPSGGGLSLLKPGLSEIVTTSVIPFNPEQAIPAEPAAANIPALPAQSILHAIKAELTELPVTALSDYALCPLRFKFRYIDGYTGYQTGSGPYKNARAIGNLTHKALELGLDCAEDLSKHNFQLPNTAVQEAFDLAQRFHTESVYQDYRDRGTLREQTVSLELNKLTLTGVVDLVGDDFVLDYKTDQEMYPEHHRFQLWAYSKATGKSKAYLAYLRHNHVHSFSAGEQSDLEQEAMALVGRLMSGDVTANASDHSCNICPYADICVSCVASPH